MTTLLTWGGVLSTPFFHLANRPVGRADVVGVTFPHSTGRWPYVVGVAQTEATSNQMIFEEQGNFRNRLVAATQAEIEAMESAIRAKLQSTSILGTLRYVMNSGFDSGSLENYELVEFTLGTWEQLLSGPEDKRWQRVFRARFVKWH